MLTDRLGKPVNVGDFILYATKTEAPSIEFAWVVEIKDGVNQHRRSGHRVKIKHANPDGTLKTKQVFDYDPITEKGQYRDTGKPVTVTLSTYSSQDFRMLVTQPSN